MIKKIIESMECTLLSSGRSGTLTISKIDYKHEELNNRFQKLSCNAVEAGMDDSYTTKFKQIVDEMAKLKEQKTQIENSLAHNAEMRNRIVSAKYVMENNPSELKEWDKPTIRQLVEMVKRVGEDEIVVYIIGNIKNERFL